ncbi:MAG: glycoside hydrolase family 2 TIM barrel-domain containing protein [Armatimonadota bacterium]|nr:glycoside hydrolase family 2 TIM barrel-domain containing protein [Armatimonadota bacterium]
MKKQYNLSKLHWKLSGWIPEYWRLNQTAEIGTSPDAEIPAIPAHVPGSVQHALLEAGIIPDWNVGLNFRECEWVENRHWIYEVAIPDEWIEARKTFRLKCLGLDFAGEVILNGKLVSDFCGSFIPHCFNLTPHLQEKGNILRIVFTTPPRWLGQFGYTSKMKDWKVRFNYTWDWTARLVQIGIWDDVILEVTDGREIKDFRCFTDADPVTATGIIQMNGLVSARKSDLIRITLTQNKQIIRTEEVPPEHISQGVIWEVPSIELWWPNMEGQQPLYILSCTLVDKEGRELDQIDRRIGFKHVRWVPCEDAPENADPWICEVNGRPIFLQGVNWTPIRTNFADVTIEDYRKRLELYRDLGCNVLRVWGGAVLEKECFYDLCDELGILVWQEFPLSSSGVDNLPPDDEKTIREMSEIAKSYIARRQHHVSLLLWSGGNELMYLDGKPVDISHPLIKRFHDIVKNEDPTRRFLPTSASGPSEWGSPENFGKGIHWDVHGPWKAVGNLECEWSDYWKNDDALFRSEVGAPSASPTEIIRKSAGKLPVMPATPENPLWRRTSTWWIEWHEFVAEKGREPESLDEYVAWSQERQKKALAIAVKACKGRFPRCGGIILWMGHDCFPCTANTAIVDFEGNPKPAALELKEIWRNPSTKPL